jgi:hypothetical protein
MLLILGVIFMVIAFVLWHTWFQLPPETPEEDGKENGEDDGEEDGGAAVKAAGAGRAAGGGSTAKPSLGIPTGGPKMRVKRGRESREFALSEDDSAPSSKGDSELESDSGDNDDLFGNGGRGSIIGPQIVKAENERTTFEALQQSFAGLFNWGAKENSTEVVQK